MANKQCSFLFLFPIRFSYLLLFAACIFFLIFRNHPLAFIEMNVQLNTIIRLSTDFYGDFLFGRYVHLFNVRW